MLKIDKSKTPDILKEYQSRPNDDYGSIISKDKKEILSHLVDEQNGLCAYCMRRISVGNDSATIEHISPQNPINGQYDRESSLDYNNMLAVCYGNRGASLKYQTCDAHKGNNPIHINLFSQHDIDKIKYRNNGEIFSDDKIINQDITDVLNLNCSKVSLPENRKSVLDALVKYVSKACNSGKSKSVVCKNILQKYENTLEKPEFYGIILWKLNIWLRQ